MPTLACIHTSTVFLTSERLMEDLFADLLPDVRRINIVDDAMLADVQATGRVDERMCERFRCCARAAESAGADVILSLCSSLGPAAVAAAAAVDVPLLTIDQAMCAEAVARGRRILVLATVPTTLDPTLARCRDEATAAGRAAAASEGNEASPYGEEPADVFTNVHQPDGAHAFTDHYPDGSPKAKGFAFAGAEGRVLHGPYQAWHPTGDLASEGHWQQGRRHGAWHFWHPGGQQRLEGFFVEGQLDRARFWVERDEGGGWVDGHVAAARAAGIQHQGDTL